MATKFLKKITIGTINGVRGGLKDIHGRERVGTIIGVANSYKEHVSETMGISWGFKGEFRAINRDGEEAVSAVCYLPEPAQSLLYAALKDESRVSGVKFGFEVWAIEDETALKGYVFELVSMMDPQPSNELAALAQEIGYEAPQGDLALEHHAEAEVPTGKELVTAERASRVPAKKTATKKTPTGRKK
jgi:hypothetical protein